MTSCVGRRAVAGRAEGAMAGGRGARGGAGARAALALALALAGTAGCRVAPEPIWKAGDRPSLWEAERLPLRVQARELAAPLRRSLDDAIAHLNGAVGCQLLRREDDALEPEVVVEAGDGAEGGGAAARTRRRLVAGRLFAAVELSDPGSVTQAYLALAHELGHVLGLAHDPYAASIMVPNVTDHERRRWLPTLSAVDARALRERYCPARPAPPERPGAALAVGSRRR